MDSLIHPFKVWNIDGLAQWGTYISNALWASFAFARFEFRVCVRILEVIIVIAFDTDLQVRLGCDRCQRFYFFKFRVRSQFLLLLAWSRSFRIIRNEFLSKLNQSFGSRLIVCRKGSFTLRWDEMVMVRWRWSGRLWFDAHIVFWLGYWQGRHL